MITVVAIALTTLFVAGCQKESLLPTPNDSLTDSALLKSSLRVYYDDGTVPGEEGKNYGCAGSGGNCLGDVVVTPAHQPAIDSVFTAVFMAKDN